MNIIPEDDGLIDICEVRMGKFHYGILLELFILEYGHQFFQCSKLYAHNRAIFFLITKYRP